MKKALSFVLILTGLMLGFQQDLSAQAPPKPRKSPLAIAAFKAQKTYIKVVYSQPFKNDREIFGGLVPYNKVWRTGANEATEITVTQKIKVAGKVLQPGTYTIFSIPGKEKWSVIFNSVVGLWGDYEYKPECDVLKVEVPANAVDTPWEAFTIKFENNGNMANMTLVWDKTAVIVPIEILK